MNAIRLHHTDITPGMMFFFDRTARDMLSHVGTDDNTIFKQPGAWMIIQRDCVKDELVCYWRYLLLGPNNVLAWHTGTLGWIFRINRA